MSDLDPSFPAHAYRLTAEAGPPAEPPCGEARPVALSQPQPHSPFRLPAPASAQGKFTRAAEVRFLDSLATRGHVRAACAAIGVSAQAAYLHRRRSAQFARGWDAALVLARRAAESELAVRALEGVEEEIWFRGELVGVRRRHDSRLLLAHLARLDKACSDNGDAGAEACADAERFDDFLLALSRGEVLSRDPRPTDPDEPVPPGVAYAAPQRDDFAEEAANAAVRAWDAAEPARIAATRAEARAAAEAARAAGREPPAAPRLTPAMRAAREAEAFRARDAVGDAAWLAAAAEWDAGQAALHARVDAIAGGEEERPPVEYKSLDALRDGGAAFVAARQPDPAPRGGGDDRPDAALPGRGAFAPLDRVNSVNLAACGRADARPGVPPCLVPDGAGAWVWPRWRASLRLAASRDGARPAPGRRNAGL